MKLNVVKLQCEIARCETANCEARNCEAARRETANCECANNWVKLTKLAQATDNGNKHFKLLRLPAPGPEKKPTRCGTNREILKKPN